MINAPYVKEYHEGELLNPIQGTYPQPYQNRRQRRQFMWDMAHPNQPLHGHRPVRIQKEKNALNGKDKYIFHYSYKKNGQ